MKCTAYAAIVVYSIPKYKMKPGAGKATTKPLIKNHECTRMPPRRGRQFAKAFVVHYGILNADGGRRRLGGFMTLRETENDVMRKFFVKKQELEQ